MFWFDLGRIRQDQDSVELWLVFFEVDFRYPIDVFAQPTGSLEAGGILAHLIMDTSDHSTAANPEWSPFMSGSSDTRICLNGLGEAHSVKTSMEIFPAGSIHAFDQRIPWKSAWSILEGVNPCAALQAS